MYLMKEVWIHVHLGTGQISEGASIERFRASVARAIRYPKEPLAYDCIGCKKCWGADAIVELANHFDEVELDTCGSGDEHASGGIKSAVACSNRYARSSAAIAGWPPHPGEYVLGNPEGTVAICTLSNRDLPVRLIAAGVAHALYVGACAASPPSGWTDFDISADVVGPLGLGAYWRGQDYFIGFSYALAAAFATWALSRSILFGQGRTVTAGAAAGGMTLVGALMAGGCFLIGCCGSPMLAVYLSLFGAKALGLGKPLMALVTLISVSFGYWCLSRRLARGSTCMDDCRSRSDTSNGLENINRFKLRSRKE